MVILRTNLNCEADGEGRREGANQPLPGDVLSNQAGITVFHKKKKGQLGERDDEKAKIVKRKCQRGLTASEL